jgi:hypothetical protein
MLSVIKLNVYMLNVVMQYAVMLNVVMFNVMASLKRFKVCISNTLMTNDNFL